MLGSIIVLSSIGTAYAQNINLDFDENGTLSLDIVVKPGKIMHVHPGVELIVPAEHRINIHPGGALVNEGTIRNSGVITNEGTMLNDDKMFNEYQGTINNFGTFTNYLQIFSEGLIENTGIWNNNSIVDNFEYVRNSGIVFNDGRFYFADTFTNSGEFRNSCDGTVHLHEFNGKIEGNKPIECILNQPVRAVDITSLQPSFELEGSNTSSNESSGTAPVWIKQTASWWIEGQIQESQFLDSIKWLIENKIITLPMEPALDIEMQNRELNVRVIELEMQNEELKAQITEFKVRELEQANAGDRELEATEYEEAAEYEAAKASTVKSLPPVAKTP